MFAFHFVVSEIPQTKISHTIVSREIRLDSMLDTQSSNCNILSVIDDFFYHAVKHVYQKVCFSEMTCSHMAKSLRSDVALAARSNALDIGVWIESVLMGLGVLLPFVCDIIVLHISAGCDNGSCEGDTALFVWFCDIPFIEGVTFAALFTVSSIFSCDTVISSSTTHSVIVVCKVFLKNAYGVEIYHCVPLMPGHRSQVCFPLCANHYEIGCSVNSQLVCSALRG